MKIEVSNGEVIDKITILEIKLEKITAHEKLQNIRKEYNMLTFLLPELGIEKSHPLYKDLKNINLELWDIEDRLRIKEKRQEFDDEFIKLARSVYFKNDRRAEIKKEINRLSNSLLTEEKEYVDYKNNT